MSRVFWPRCNDQMLSIQGGRILLPLEVAGTFEATEVTNPGLSRPRKARMVAEDRVEDGLFKEMSVKTKEGGTCLNPGEGAGSSPTPSAVKAPVGGRLAGFSKSWQDAPKWQRSVLARGLGWRFSRPPPLKKNLPVKLPCEKRLNSLLKDLLGKKVIEKSCDKFVFISRLKLVPKPSGEFRLILDVSRLNKYIPPLSFKMPKLSDLRAILPKGAWLAKIDLKDAYHHVPIRKSFRKFLAFRWGNRVYHFKALPFGLSVAPAVFTGMMNPSIRSSERRVFQPSHI